MPEPPAAVFVLIVIDNSGSYSDVLHAWGPFATEKLAQEAWARLNEIGVPGEVRIVPLRAGLLMETVR